MWLLDIPSSLHVVAEAEGPWLSIGSISGGDGYFQAGWRPIAVDVCLSLNSEEKEIA